MCIAYLILDNAVLIGHWGMMLWHLQAWCGGSFFMFMMTVYSTFQSVLSGQLLVGDPLWMTAPRKYRMTSFILAFMSVTFFLGQFMFLILNYFGGDRPMDTYREII